MPTKTNEAIERFRKEFLDKGLGFEGMWIEQFILDELANQEQQLRKELRDKVEKMRKKDDTEVMKKYPDNYHYVVGFNQALLEVLKLIEEV